MIAANYRKHPDAMALQLPLPFARMLVWATARPTTKALRAIRSLRGATFKAAGRIRYPEPPVTPDWVRAASKRARKLAAQVKKAQIHISERTSTELTGYAAHLARCRETFNVYSFTLH